MRKRRTLIMLGLIVATTAFTALVTTFRPVARIGPFYNSTLGYDTSIAGGQAGGEVRIYKNGADTLIVGDVVYFSARNTVFKSATLVNYNAIAGVVVGGTRTGMLAVSSPPLATDTAATSGQNVLVMSRGRTWVRIDASAGIAPGLAVIPSTNTAGMVMVRTTAIDTFNRIFAKLVDTGIVSTRVLAQVNVR